MFFINTSKIKRNEFINSLFNQKERLWRYVNINGHDTNYLISSDGKLISKKCCREMSPHENTSGYLETVICDKGRRINVSIHRLVAEAFVKNPENKPAVNHKDGDKLNNVYTNLEWTTNKENNDHAIRIGLRSAKVIRHHYSKQQIIDVCVMISERKSIAEIHRTTGVSKLAIRNIKAKKTRRNISDRYFK